MIHFRRILSPVDFSAQSRAVVPFVKAMARRFDAEVVVLHAVEIPHGMPAIDPLRMERRVALEQFAAQEFAGTRVVVELAEGDAAQAIVNYAHGREIDLIMLPTHGYGPFRALLLGSVTAKVLHDARCPVWTGVHAEEMTSHAPDRWEKMLCAVDDIDGKDAPVLKWASEFAQSQGMELLLVHAVAGAEGVFTHESDPSMYEFLLNAARGRLAKIQAEAGTALEIRLRGGSVGAVAHQVALETQADLIVTGRGAAAKAFGALRSNAYAIIRQAPCPVISI
jgi:nucleotide-binding universal stress UspA family protein